MWPATGQDTVQFKLFKHTHTLINTHSRSQPQQQPLDQIKGQKTQRENEKDKGRENTESTTTGKKTNSYIF